MRRGLFITLEGPDGAGKSSILTGLNENLLNAGYKFQVTREPGGIDIAEQIRQVILNPKNTAMDARTEALLYAAARRQHFAERVLPALEAAEHVLCDRFIDSSLAYQGYARGLGIDQVLQINQFAIQDVMPDLSLLLMVDPELGLKRISHNREHADVDRLDLEKLEFHQKVYEGYHLLAKKYPDRISVIDASRRYSDVLADTTQVLLNFIQNY